MFTLISVGMLYPLEDHYWMKTTASIWVSMDSIDLGQIVDTKYNETIRVWIKVLLQYEYTTKI